MELQVFPHGCGPAAIVNALATLGHTGLAQEAVADLARTDADGTDERGIKRALRRLGYRASDVRVDGDGPGAWMTLCGALLMGYPAILAVDSDSHWIAAVGLIGGAVLIADSADGGIVQSLNRRALLERWTVKRGRVSQQYAIIVQPT